MEEEDDRSSAHLRVVFRRGEEEYTLTSAWQLAEMLMDPHWPVYGPAYFKASELLLAFLEGESDVSIQELCDAFAEAMEEAERQVKNPIEVDCDPLN